MQWIYVVILKVLWCIVGGRGMKGFFKGGPPLFLEFGHEMRFRGQISKTSNAFISASFEDMNTL